MLPFALNTGAPRPTVAEGPLVAARDAAYVSGGYRSFEFADLEVSAGQVAVLLSTDRAPARDLALAVAGFVEPTAGSLIVNGVELARPARRRLTVARAGRLPRKACGVGVFSGLFDVDGSRTVGETVAREMRLRRAGDADVLAYLAEHLLATYADQRLDQLPPSARARLSGALACAGGVGVAALDLSDPYIEGLPAQAAREVVCELGAIARKRGICVIAAAQELACADVADVVCPLDLTVTERLGCRHAAIAADAATRDDAS